MTAALDELVATLDLERIELNIFRGDSPGSSTRVRVFGGQVAGQALVAAGRTVTEVDGPPRLVHSLHAYFLRPGDPTIPILYEVDRIRDGKSFATRRVAAIQRGEAIFHLSASFHVAEEGVSHQEQMPDAPDPETLPDWRVQHGALRRADGRGLRLPQTDRHPAGRQSGAHPPGRGGAGTPSSGVVTGGRQAARRSAPPRLRRRLRRAT